MKPERVFRIGSVSASVFLNEITTDEQTVQRHTVNLHRRYQDNESKEWKSTSIFRLAELPQAMTVLQLAIDYVAEKEA